MVDRDRLGRELTKMAIYAAMGATNPDKIQEYIDATWDQGIQDLCDAFPDVESLMPVDDMRRLYIEEVGARMRLLRLVKEPLGPERIIKQVVEALAYTDANESPHRVLRESYGDRVSAGYIVEKIAVSTGRFGSWFLQCDDRNRAGFARFLYNRGRKGGSITF
jgi:hypothetical protein